MADTPTTAPADKPEWLEPKAKAKETHFQEASPLSTPQGMAAHGITSRMHYDIKEEPFRIVVPKTYDGQTPFGLLVYISASDGGAPGQFAKLAEEHRLIVVSPLKAGNKEPITRRMMLALDAVHNVTKYARIDTDRIYCVGPSGGGRLASRLGIEFADVFTGGIYSCGVDYLREVPLPAGTKSIAGTMETPPRNILQLAGMRSRHVIYSGENDFNKNEAEAVAAAAKKDGFKYVLYLEGKGEGHGILPASYAAQALAFMDKPLEEAAKGQFEAAQAAEKAGQLGAALEGYGKALAHGGDQPFVAEAKTHLAALNQRQADALGAAQADAEAKQYPHALARLRELVRAYGAAADPAAKALLAKLEGDPAVKAAVAAATHAAATELQGARKLLADKKTEEAKAKLGEILEKYAGTPAAEEAKGLLGKL